MVRSIRNALCLFISVSANTAQAVEQEVLPDVEFLEFLGKWETDEGEWISPGILLEEQFGQILDAAYDADASDEYESGNDTIKSPQEVIEDIIGTRTND
jgi:hypothetical protein